MADTEDRSPYITVTSGMAGYFAVLMWWNPDPGFWEPYQTGMGRYRKHDDAVKEAKFWAHAEDVRYVE